MSDTQASISFFNFIYGLLKKHSHNVTFDGIKNILKIFKKKKKKNLKHKTTNMLTVFVMTKLTSYKL